MGWRKRREGESLHVAGTIGAASARRSRVSRAAAENLFARWTDGQHGVHGWLI